MKSLGQACMLVLLAFIVSVFLPGCADVPDDSHAIVRCNLPVTRTDGMGIKHADCAAWTIGNWHQTPMWYGR